MNSRSGATCVDHTGAIQRLGEAEGWVVRLFNQTEGDEKYMLAVAINYIHLARAVLHKLGAPEIEQEEEWTGNMKSFIRLALYVKKALGERPDCNAGWTPHGRPGCFLRQPADLPCSDCANPIPSVIRARINVEACGGLTATFRVQIAPTTQSDGCPSCSGQMKPTLYIAPDCRSGDTLSIGVALESRLDPEIVEGIDQVITRLVSIGRAELNLQERMYDNFETVVAINSVDAAHGLLLAIRNGDYKLSDLMVPDSTQQDQTPLQIVSDHLVRHLTGFPFALNCPSGR